MGLCSFLKGLRISASTGTECSARARVSCLCGDEAHTIPIWKCGYVQQFETYRPRFASKGDWVVEIPMQLFFVYPHNNACIESLPDLGRFIQAVLQTRFTSDSTRLCHDKVSPKILVLHCFG